MNKFFIALWIAVIATAQVNGYSSGGGDTGDGGPMSDGVITNSVGEPDGGSANLPFMSVPGGNGFVNGHNMRYQTVSSSISYPFNKGEILVHRPAAIIVKRPPTKVVVNHPPLVVKPAPVVLHKPPAVIVRKVSVKHHPRPVKVEPVYVNVVKPPAEKYFVNDKLPNTPVGAGSYVATSGGLQMLQDNNMAVGGVGGPGGFQMLQPHNTANMVGNYGRYSPDTGASSYDPDTRY